MAKKSLSTQKVKSGEMIGTYTVHCECSNCEKDGQLQLPKGTPVSGKHICPHCGCKTAEMRSSKIRIKPEKIDWPTLPPLADPYLPYPSPHKPWTQEPPWKGPPIIWMQPPPNTTGINFDCGESNG